MNSYNKILEFYLLAGSLKTRLRQGFIYWNVSEEKIQSVADHIYSTCIMAIGIYSEFKEKYLKEINIDRILKMLVIHELEEVIIGDITPFDNVSEEERIAMGRKAVVKILSLLKDEKEYLALLDEFNARNTNNALFAYYCDKLDFDLQMKIYYDNNEIKLEKEIDKHVASNPKVKEMLKNGLNTSEITFKYDEPKFIKDGSSIKIPFTNLYYYAQKQNFKEVFTQAKNNINCTNSKES